jgi:chitinase
MPKPVVGFVSALIGVGLIVHPAPASGTSDPPHTAGPVTIQSVPNGRVVDVDRGVVQDGRRVQEWTYNGSAAQRWLLRPAGTHYMIRAYADPAFCLGRDAGGAPVRVIVRPCDGRLTDWDLEALGGERFRIKDPRGDVHIRVQDEIPTNGRDLVAGSGGQVGAEWYLTGLDVPRRAMPADPRLDQLTFLVAHNAMANSDEGFRWRFPNQSYRLRDQLRHGVRGLQLDVYAHRGDVRMCHGRCWGNERTLTAGLQDVVDFLRGDGNAVVTVFLEDYTTVDQLREALERVTGLQQLLLDPRRFGVRERGWPHLSELASTNQRLLIFSQRPGRDGFGVLYDRDWTAENYWSLGAGGTALDCYSRWNEVPLAREEPGFRRLHVMNHYRDLPTEGAAVADNGPRLHDRVHRLCGPSARRKPNYVAVDFYQKPETVPIWELIRDLNTYW